MTVVERIYREPELPGGARSYDRDTITLGWEERTHAHGRRRTDGGVEFGTSLPRATVLNDGDCLLLGRERLVVSVLERAEPVVLIEPRDASERALTSHHLANLHQSVMIT